MLKPENSGTRASIAASLGFEWLEDRKETEKIKILQREPINSQLPTNSQEPIGKEQPVTSVVMLEPAGREKPVDIVFDCPDEIKELEQTNPERLKSPEHQPLLCDNWFRGLVIAMLSTPGTSKYIDWKKLKKRLEKGEPLDMLPLRQLPTLKRGVMLFLDRSDSMQPFWRDEKELFNRLSQLLGSHNVHVWWPRVDRWSSARSRLQIQSPPCQFPSGTPLLIVSDFGIGEGVFQGYVDLGPWLPLLDTAQINNCPVIALIPAPESLLPGVLRQVIPYTFVWDRDTTIQSVRRLRRKIC